MNLRPFRDIKRRKTREIKVGKVKVGGDNPISVQSMTNTLTTDIKATINQINEIQEEGADIVMVKPALSFLDIIRDVKNAVNLPVAAYNVSGEYSMVKAASKLNWIDESKVRHEILTSIKRAGADMIITYFAKSYAESLK